MDHFRGLTVISRSGILWRWVGYAIACLRGRDWRVEKWEAQCPRCGETITIRAKLPRWLRSHFYLRRYNVPPSQIVEVRLSLDSSKLLDALNIGECHEHEARNYRDPGIGINANAGTATRIFSARRR